MATMATDGAAASIDREGEQTRDVVSNDVGIDGRGINRIATDLRGVHPTWGSAIPHAQRVASNDFAAEAFGDEPAIDVCFDANNARAAVCTAGAIAVSARSAIRRSHC